MTRMAGFRGTSVWAVGLVAVACGTTSSFVQNNSPPHAMVARSPDEVEVHTVQPPARDFVDVGVVEVQERSDFVFTRPAEAVALLRSEAARHGCDSIVVHTETQSPGLFSSAGVRTFRATCIVYR